MNNIVQQPENDLVQDETEMELSSLLGYNKICMCITHGQVTLIMVSEWVKWSDMSFPLKLLRTNKDTHKWHFLKSAYA